ncbi:hypothetical protein [Rhodococcus qingshengii]|uniref:hypothetical protein n=1 Tax=Rhodococcus qingshengii TaxID=334542 RepID=UPI001AE09229|nr:hypothetical protein [Rhodococcus qingshengii]
MPAIGHNPVLTPIRRWVLYSRTNLAISIVSVFAVLVAVGQILGTPDTTTAESPSAAEPGRQITDTARPTSAPHASEEVTQAHTAAMSSATVALSAQATAMTYAHHYTDHAANNDAWASALAALVPNGALTPNFRAARPTVAVTITGPTHTTTAPADGPNAATVTVPTSAGTLKVHLVQSESGTRPWLVTTPLPTLDTVSDNSEPAATAVPTTTAPNSATTATSTSQNSEPTTSQAPSTPQEPLPTPAPGPIPVPDLNTPLPGAM